MGKKATLCEYKRCGTSGKRRIATGTEWPAHVNLTLGWKGPARAPETWKVCEHCASLLIRDRDPNQEVISKEFFSRPKKRPVKKKVTRKKKKVARKKKSRSKKFVRTRGGLTKKERTAKARKAFLERTAKKD